MDDWIDGVIGNFSLQEPFIQNPLILTLRCIISSIYLRSLLTICELNKLKALTFSLLSQKRSRGKRDIEPTVRKINAYFSILEDVATHHAV